jgi:hypothetical protein
MRFLRVGVGVLMGLVACRERPVADATDVEVEPPAASASTTAAPIEREDVAVLGTWRLPRAEKNSPVLGAPCSVDSTSRWKPETICGTKDRVSLEVQFYALMGMEPPCEMIEVSPKTSMQRVTGCVEGDLMIINSHCVMCRVMDAGTAVRARLSELTPVQLEELRNQSGMGEAAPKTADGWRALFAKR